MEHLTRWLSALKQTAHLWLPLVRVMTRYRPSQGWRVPSMRVIGVQTSLTGSTVRVVIELSGDDDDSQTRPGELS